MLGKVSAVVMKLSY